MPDRRFLIIGHRGAAAHAPENTAASLRAGLDGGAGAIEIDVGLSRDGRAVLLHDATLDRTTDGTGPLARRTWRELERLDAGRWFAPRFAGESLVDLDGALALVRGRVPIIVEIKSTGPRDASPGERDLRLLDEVVAALERTCGLEGATVSSTAWLLLAAGRDRAPGLDLALTVGMLDRRDPLAWAPRIGATALHPNRRLCSVRWVTRARDEGLRVYPYTVNTARELDPLLAAGVDGVFTDDPAGVRRLVARRRPEADAAGPLLLGIDQGSGGTRAVLVGRDGRLAGVSAVRVASRRMPDGTLVQDAEALAASVVRAAAPLLAGAMRPVEAAGLAAQRSSLVVWRRSDGRPVTPVISWRPGSPFETPSRVRRDEERIARLTGLSARFPYGALRLSALCSERPELSVGLADGTLRAGPVGVFLAARLADRDAAADPSLAQRMLLLDVRTRDWSEPLARLTGVPLRALPDLLPSAAHRGALRIEGRRIPLRALVGDVGAAARACLPDDARRGLLVLGTGGFVVVTTGRRPERATGLLTSVLWEDAIGARYAIEGTVHGVVASIVEAGRRAGSKQGAPELIAASSGTARRAPRVLPAPEGLGTPEWDLTPRFELEPGDWSGDEIVRGTVEGLAERFGRIADLLRAAGRLPACFVATGGLAFAPHLVHAVAVRMGVAVEVDPAPQQTAVGAALLAAHSDAR